MKSSNLHTGIFLFQFYFSLEKVPRSGFTRSRTLKILRLSQVVPCYFSGGLVGSRAKEAALLWKCFFVVVSCFWG